MKHIFKEASIVILLYCSPIFIFAQQANISIVPQPMDITTKVGSFMLSSTTNIDGVKATTLAKQYFQHYLSQYYGFTIESKKAIANIIQLEIVKHLPSISSKEGYTLEVTPQVIHIKALSDTGIFYGIQTLIQLLPPQKQSNNQLLVPAVAIVDQPRFAYRGMSLDVSRHFFDVDFIKKYIDILALHKLNVFHWHLTDDQGWRIEIKKYPLLTKIGGFRNGTIVGSQSADSKNDHIQYGGYYTQVQIKDVIKYAADRYITVVPEIEMPGHASAAIAAYSQLSCFPDSAMQTLGYAWAGSVKPKQVQQLWGVFSDILCPSDYTVSFMKNVMDEVCNLFPSPIIHLGGDEADKSYWKGSALCQRLIKENHLKDEDELQTYFMEKIEDHVTKKHKIAFAWDEVLRGRPHRSLMIMAWTGEGNAIKAANEHYNVVMSLSPLYFDHAQNKPEDSLTFPAYTPINVTYNYDPVLDNIKLANRHYILGVEGELWSEYIPNEAKVDYMLLPRLSALSEVAWTQKDNRNYDQFCQRMKKEQERYQLWEVNYSKSFFNSLP